MSNVLDEKKQQQICALGRLGWTLSRIQAATGIRRETVSGYLKAAGIAVRGIAHQLVGHALADECVILTRGYVTRVPLTRANDVRECGRVRIRLVISRAWMPRASSASAISDR